MKTRWMVTVSLLGIGLFLGLFAASCRTTKSTTNSTTSTIPQFSLQSLNGKTVTLSEFKGKVVLLDFWATWCPPCRASLPHTQQLSQSADVKSGKLVVLGVNQREKPADVQAFMTKNGYTFPVLLDTRGEAFSQFGSDGIPTFVIIDKQGNVAWQQVGFDEAGMTKALQEILAK